MKSNPEHIEEKVIKGIEEWVAKHPKPDNPLLICGRNTYSPKQCLEEVKTGTKRGFELAKAYQEYYHISSE